MKIILINTAIAIGRTSLESRIIFILAPITSKINGSALLPNSSIVSCNISMLLPCKPENNKPAKIDSKIGFLTILMRILSTF